MAAKTKKLYKSSKDKVLTGVLGGFGEYFDVDPIIVRLVFIVFTLLTGLILGLIVYIVAALIIPEKK